jgi:general stress protein YciG
VCGKAGRTSVGDLDFCPDHSEKDLAKSEIGKKGGEATKFAEETDVAEL